MTLKIRTKQLVVKKTMVIVLSSLLFPCFAYGTEKHDLYVQDSQELAGRMAQTFEHLQGCLTKALRLYKKAIETEDFYEKAALLKETSEITKLLSEENNQTYFQKPIF